MKRNYDVVVVGGGHNGLVAANYLARAGLSVGVFERRGIVGGAALTEEVWKGFRLSRLSYAYGLFDQRVMKELELKKFGLKLIASDPDLFVPFPDGEHIFIWNSSRKTAKEFSRFSVRDAARYEDYLDYWKKVSKYLSPARETPPMSLSDLERLFRGQEGLEILRDLLFGSVSDLLDEYFESEHVKAAIAPRGLIGTMVGPKSPGSLFVLAHHVVGESTGEAGVWGTLQGGMGAVSQALATAARHHGVEIMTESPVSRILVKDGRVDGIELSDGGKVRTKNVVSNADPKQTFLKLVGSEHLDKRFAKNLEKIRDEGCVVKVNAALRELPDYTSYPGKEPGPQHRGITSIGPSVDYCERAFDEAKYGRPCTKPFLRVGNLSANDPTVAPKGKHTLSVFSQYYPYTLKSRSWDDIREEVGDSIIAALAEYAPNLTKSVIHREVLTPLDLEREFSLPRGNIFHEEITPDQNFMFRPVVGWPGYGGPIKGLFLCGSGTQGGGGVIGTPGLNAAKALLSSRGN